MASSHGCWELVLLCISFVFICNLSAGFASPVSFGVSCELNFTRFPYEPTGDCINFGKSQRKPTSQCCRNMLIALTRALALRSRSSQGNLFIGNDQWRNCSSNFTKQSLVSMESCGYDDLFYGSSHCSRLSLLGIVGRQSLIAALKECSDFNSSFDKACRKCVHAIMRARDDLMVGDEGEKTVCEVAVVISIAASKLDRRDMVYKFERCLPALDNIGSDNYMEINSSAVKSIFAIFLTTAAIWVVLKLIMHVRCKQPAKFNPLNDVAACSGLYRFSKSEIERAMNIGNEKVCLGKGSAGHVYKGILPSGQEVAIKYITCHVSNAFKREVECLSRVRHPNLVCLFGCCMEDGEPYLVCAYCSGGNLAEHLQREDAVLTGKTRVKILRDCAVALRYLHHYVDGCIVHGNIQLTNIFLTDNMEAKISDFVRAKMLKMEETKVFTKVRETVGYVDPEYVTNAKLTCASDIYSLGIVMLQLLSGNKVLELDLSARDQLTRKFSVLKILSCIYHRAISFRARDVLMGLRPLPDFEDPQLNGNINRVDFRALLLIAVLCIAELSKDRPNIDDVCEETERAWKSSWTVRDTSRSSEVACIQLQNVPTNS